GHVPFEVTTSTGPELWSAQIIAADPWHRGALDTSLQTLWVGFSISMVLAIPVSLLVCLGAYRRGREATADLLARGERLLSERQLTRLVRQRATPSRIQVGTVPIPNKALNRGFVAIGSPQSGKSVVLKRMLREARRAGDLVVVFDKVGDIVGEHYDPERGDVILNPDDERSPPWSPWSEMGEAADAYRMAKALIPSVEGQNNFFHVAAQQVFSALLTRLWHLEDRSLSAMLETFLTGTREEKAELLKGTDAGMHFTGDNRSGHDVEATARVYTQSLAFLPKTSGTGQDFSIRRFIEGVITRQEATVEEAMRRLQSIYDREISAVMEAREALREGRLGAVERTIGRRSQEFPLLPKGLKMPVSRQGTKRWWETHGRAVEAHWKAQDPAIVAGREAIAEETRSAFPRQKKRGAPGLFISTSSRQLHAVRPLISLWLDTVADTILGLPANRERRIWVFLDEIQALQKLPSLLALLTEGSKYGVVVVAGVQNLAQFRMHFGKDEAETIISMLQSKAFFRMTEPESAYWIERAIGHAITEHIAESIRYGTSTTMDGAQITPQRVNEPIVMAGDVMGQADLHCYLKMAGDWPVGAIQMKF
ncbi:MAG: type IV secretion system DNA-binding domain-containing protein, partial [Pseudomonadota bacterium]